MFNVLRRAWVSMRLAAKQLRPDNFCTNSVDLPSGKVLNKGTMKRGLGALKTLAGAAAIAATGVVGAQQAEAGCVNLTVNGIYTNYNPEFSNFDGITLTPATKLSANISYDSDWADSTLSNASMGTYSGNGTFSLRIVNSDSDYRQYDYTGITITVTNNVYSPNVARIADAVIIEPQYQNNGGVTYAGVYWFLDTNSFSGKSLERVPQLLSELPSKADRMNTSAEFGSFVGAHGPGKSVSAEIDTTSIPEPASLALLAVGSTIILRRRGMSI